MPKADIDSMTKSQLLDYAEVNGIDVNASMTKAEILDAIKNA